MPPLTRYNLLIVIVLFHQRLTFVRKVTLTFVRVCAVFRGLVDDIRHHINSHVRSSLIIFCLGDVVALTGEVGVEPTIIPNLI